MYTFLFPRILVPCPDCILLNYHILFHAFVCGPLDLRSASKTLMEDAIYQVSQLIPLPLYSISRYISAKWRRTCPLGLSSGTFHLAIVSVTPLAIIQETRS